MDLITEAEQNTFLYSTTPAFRILFRSFEFGGLIRFLHLQIF